MSAEIPYDPLHSPRKHVTLKRMGEILKSHSSDPALAGLSSELWLVWKIKEAGGDWRHLDNGVTTRDQRKERVRAQIKRSHFENLKCGKRNGKPCTFSQVFQLVYAEAL